MTSPVFQVVISLTYSQWAIYCHFAEKWIQKNRTVFKQKSVFSISNPDSFERRISFFLQILFFNKTLDKNSKLTFSLSGFVLTFAFIVFEKSRTTDRLSEILLLIFFKNFLYTYVYVLILRIHMNEEKKTFKFISFVCWTLFANCLIYIHFTVSPWISSLIFLQNKDVWLLLLRNLTIAQS